MKSKAGINGHPIHPMLIVFPVAFFTGTLVFDILARVYDNASFSQTGRYLNVAAIISALLAAVPGIIDYFYTVPPASSAKKRATAHGLINITVVALFAVALALKQNPEIGAWLIIGIEAVGVVLLGFAGYMGGTLVFRNQIGVYNRYADKGNWQESSVKQKTGTMEVATAGELKVDQMKLLHAADKRIVIGKTEKGYVAFDDRCTHKGGSLAGGVMICGTVQCPWHGSQFDVETGAVKAGPATKKINTYDIHEANGKVYVVIK
jgi:uncharacterized membrane protein/nitrite reductase/ring-hydroxylating ferredoxin subunit